MNEPVRSVRPETLALDALIEATIARAEASPEAGSADTMVFLGNRHQSFPTAVIKDPVLEPVDKLIWMVIMLSVQETGSHTAFPSYGAIAQLANVASRSTIARAIAILRATRWLTLCGRLRQASGRFRGNLYALHDEPLPLGDVIHLDGDYLAFLTKAVRHGHARVRAVAQGVLDSIDEDIGEGRNVCAPEHPLERRLQSRVGTAGGEPRRFFAFTHNAVQRLRQDAAGTRSTPDHQDQNSNAVADRVRNSNAQNSNSGSSSNNKKNKTTTPPREALSNFAQAGEAGRPLVYPQRLSGDQRDIVNRYLRALAPAQRQPILDELEGRFQAERKGMRPVYDEISFLVRLCDLTRAGTFRPNLGLKVRASRQARDARRQQAVARDTPAPETEAQRQRRRSVAQHGVAALRETLGVPPNRTDLSETQDR